MFEKIKSILVNELQYSEYAADLTARDLTNLRPQFQASLARWLEDRTMTETSVSKFSTSDLMKRKGFTYPAALIALDWLLADPAAAEKELSGNIRR